MAADKLPSLTRTYSAFNQGRPSPCCHAYVEARPCVGAASPTPCRFSPRLYTDQGARGGAISLDANIRGGGGGDVVLAQRHIMCARVL